MTERILITGAAGFLGARLLQRIEDNPEMADAVMATDIRPITPSRPELVETRILDIRDEAAVHETFDAFSPTTVIHLAAMVTPPPGDTRRLQYEVDVLGTQYVVEACLAQGVTRFLYTSSGAAYGYHPDNPPALVETDPVRGNEVFAYAHHKRLVEEYLEEVRANHPELQQLIFRVSTILGPTTDNQITALFERSLVTGIRGADAPFCIIADDDAVDALFHGLKTGRQGVFNLTGDGVLHLSEIAELMGGRYLALPEHLVRLALKQLSRHGLSPYGPEQVIFLKHRPVLDNRALKEDFGFTPTYTSRQAFERYRKARQDTAPVVLITGAAGGLGRALAEEHARRGARLALVDLRPADLDLDGDHLIIEADLTSEEDCRRAVDETLERFGELHVLYNNAGLPLRSLFHDADLSRIHEVLDVNLMGSIRMTHAALPHLIAARGRIAVISSVAGFAPLKGRTAYAASKHGLHGFFESLRTEVDDQGVSITMVCPSYLSTEFRQNARDGATEVDASEAARQIADAVLNRRRQALVGTTAHVSYWLRRVAPGLFERLMERSVRSEFP